MFLGFLPSLIAIGILLPHVPVLATTCPTSGNDVTIAANCIFDAGTYTFTGTLTINAGVTVTAASNVGSGQVVIISDSITIDGTLTGDATGFAITTGTGEGTNGTSAGGGGYGGDGGDSQVPVAGGITYGSLTQPISLGSGGGQDTNCNCGGGAGGGSIKLQATGTVTISATGIVTAGGQTSTSSDGGGGSGGSIWIDVTGGTLAGSGTLRANGGSAIGTGGGGGGGGRVALYYATNTFSGATQAFGGSRTGSGHAGGAGTIFRDDTDDGIANGDLVVNNNDNAGIGATSETTQIAGTSFTFRNLTINNGADYVIPANSSLTVEATVGTFTTGGSVQPEIRTVNGSPQGRFDPSTSTFTFTGIDVTNDGAIGVVTDMTLGPDSYFIHNGATGTYPATLNTLVVASTGTFSESQIGAFIVATSVTVQSGGEMTHEDNTTARTHTLIVQTPTMTIDALGAVDVSNLGFDITTGTGQGGDGTSAAGGSYGGDGGNSASGALGGGTYGSMTIPNNLGSGGGQDTTCNCGGGAGGGEARFIVSGTFTVNGNIVANGQSSGASDGGGGSGGTIWVDNVGTLAGSGAIRANGGNASGTGGGGGGGGRISLNYATLTHSGSREAFGGIRTGTGHSGGAGTIFMDDTDDGIANGDLVISNNNNAGIGSSSETTQGIGLPFTVRNLTIHNGARYVIPASSTLTVEASVGSFTAGGTVRPSLQTNSSGRFNPPTSTFNFQDIDVINDGMIGVVTDMTVGPDSYFIQNTSTGSFPATLSTLIIDSTGTVSTTNTGTFAITTSVTVLGGGLMRHEDNSSTEANKLIIQVPTFTIDATGNVDVSNLGFDVSLGSGQGTDGTSAGGGGHGGDGGNGVVGAGGITYGNLTVPVNVGSGGGQDTNCNCGGGTGGGAVRLIVSGTLTVNGDIIANGQSSGSNEGGGGSGGTIYLDGIGTLAGTGAIRANGGNASGSGGGGGGGGRISLNYATLAHTGAREAFGGNRTGSGHAGGAGTIVMDDTNDGLIADLIVSNNNNSGIGSTSQTTQIPGTSFTFRNVTINDGGRYAVSGTSTFTIEATVGTLTTGGIVQPAIQTINGSPKGTFNVPTSTFTFQNIDVTNDGSIGVVTDLTVDGSSTFVQNSATGTFPATLANLVVASTGTFSTSQASTFVVSTSVTVQSGGTMTHEDNSTAETHKLIIQVPTFTIDATGTVTAASIGFDRTTGTGQGTDGTSGAGAGHCASGGASQSGAGGGGVYGSSTSPTTIGSGGGQDTNSNTGGGTGGGAIRLIVSGTLTVNGTLSANGGNSTAADGGGGSGGSIWLDNIGTWAGSGTTTANGGNASGTGGGGGGAGYVRATYGTKTYSGTLTSNGGTRTGTGVNGGNCTPSEQSTGNPVPTTTSISPETKHAGDPDFTLTVNGTNFIASSVVRFEGSDRATTFGSGTQLMATILASDIASGGAYAITVFNPGPGGGISNAQSLTVTTSLATIGNKVILSRLKVSVSSTADVYFTLQNTLSGPLTVTFPAEFTVTSAPTGGSPCLSGFGFTASTFTAIKTSCSGAIALTGGTVTNPASPGLYAITWVNDDPGGASVFIVSDDQVFVNAAVEPTLSFNVGSQASATACDGTFAGNGGTVPLGALTTSTVASSDAASVPHICTRLTSNAVGGSTVTVRSLNASLRSTSVPGDTIPSSTTTLTPGTAGYGVCAGSAGADSGMDVTIPAGTAPTRSAPFNGTSCTSTGHDVGGLTTSQQNIWTVAGPTQNAFMRVYVKAAISSSTPAHSDYTDTLTFVVTGTY